MAIVARAGGVTVTMDSLSQKLTRRMARSAQPAVLGVVQAEITKVFDGGVALWPVSSGESKGDMRQVVAVSGSVFSTIQGRVFNTAPYAADIRPRDLGGPRAVDAYLIEPFAADLPRLVRELTEAIHRG